jgi:hypothetical protein
MYINKTPVYAYIQDKHGQRRVSEVKGYGGVNTIMGSIQNKMEQIRVWGHPPSQRRLTGGRDGEDRPLEGDDLYVPINIRHAFPFSCLLIWARRAAAHLYTCDRITDGRHKSPVALSII